MALPPPASRDRAVARWLFVCAGFVATMVAVGGLTRLTRSGLSIVEWKPLLGALPPLGDAAWADEFSKYRTSPESKLVNVDLSLEGFKQIYYVEWFHRLLGRLTGAVVLIPFVFFLVKKRIGKGLAMKVVLLFILGGLQGLVGWLMVASGLVDVPHVSPYRLTTHLLFALLLFAALFWVALDVGFPRHPVGAKDGSGLRRASQLLLALIALTITWGGLMAGFHAGLVASTFPTINGAWVPDGMWTDTPLLENFVNNPLTIHFTHRLLAYATVVGAGAVGVVLLRREGSTQTERRLGATLAAIAVLQALLGVMTVMTLVQVSWASLHQLNAVCLLAVIVATIHELTPA